MSEHDGSSTTDKIADGADKVAETVRKAIEDGIKAIKPTWEEKVVPAWEGKVAPAIATGAGKVAEWGDDVRAAADKKSAELSAGDRPSDKILGGALGVGAAAAALGISAARWVSKEAGQVGRDDAGTTTTDEPGSFDGPPQADGD